jgi:LacI family transcriptional regulator
VPRLRTKATNIGMVFLHTLAYYRRALRGVWRYAEARPHWEFTSIIPEKHSLKMHRRFRPDGLIVTANTIAFEKALRSWRRPAVNVSAVIPGQRFPRVGVDNVLVGQIAAAHFLERGLQHFAFVGPPSQVFASERQAAFCDAISKTGAAVDCYISRAIQEFDPHGLHWDLEAGVQRWLQKLSKPVGIFTPNDLWGVQVLMACRRAGLRVPEEVAVLGVDNDTLYCEMTRPGLSSVIVPAEQIGYEAAGLLERLLSGEPAPQDPVLLPPVGVRSRRSSEVLAIEDESVAAAVRFIRQQAHQPLQVDDVLKRVPV